jgi:hypothetical protein
MTGPKPSLKERVRRFLGKYMDEIIDAQSSTPVPNFHIEAYEFPGLQTPNYRNISRARRLRGLGG